jgi:hypothetical protein
LRCQEESGEVTNVGDVTDISTDIDGTARDSVCQTGSWRRHGTYLYEPPIPEGSFLCR